MYKLCCDRCNKEIDALEQMCTVEYKECQYLGVKEMLSDMRHSRGMMHLCDECNKAFQLFLNNNVKGV